MTTTTATSMSPEMATLVANIERRKHEIGMNTTDLARAAGIPRSILG